MPQKEKISAEEKIAAVESWQQDRMSKLHFYNYERRQRKLGALRPWPTAGCSKVPHNVGPRLWRGPEVFRFFICLLDGERFSATGSVTCFTHQTFLLGALIPICFHRRFDL